MFSSFFCMIDVPSTHQLMIDDTSAHWIAETLTQQTISVTGCWIWVWLRSVAVLIIHRVPACLSTWCPGQLHAANHSFAATSLRSFRSTQLCRGFACFARKKKSCCHAAVTGLTAVVQCSIHRGRTRGLFGVYANAGPGITVKLCCRHTVKSPWQIWQWFCCFAHSCHSSPCERSPVGSGARDLRAAPFRTVKPCDAVNVASVAPQWQLHHLTTWKEHAENPTSKRTSNQPFWHIRLLYSHFA